MAKNILFIGPTKPLHQRRTYVLNFLTGNYARLTTIITPHSQHATCSQCAAHIVTKQRKEHRRVSGKEGQMTEICTRVLKNEGTVNPRLTVLMDISPRSPWTSMLLRDTTQHRRSTFWSIFQLRLVQSSSNVRVRKFCAKFFFSSHLRFVLPSKTNKTICTRARSEEIGFKTWGRVSRPILGEKRDRRSISSPHEKYLLFGTISRSRETHFFPLIPTTKPSKTLVSVCQEKGCCLRQKRYLKSLQERVVYLVYLCTLLRTSNTAITWDRNHWILRPLSTRYQRTFQKNCSSDSLLREAAQNTNGCAECNFVDKIIVWRRCNGSHGAH